MKILFICNHRGGANVIYPILEILDKKKFLLITTLLNKDYFKKYKKKIKVIKNKLNEDKIKKIFYKFKPQLVITGTSETIDLNIGCFEQKFIKFSKKSNIYCISIMDFWSNYEIRFSTSIKREMDAIPDKICVMNKFMKDEMISKGFKKNNLCVTGNPYLEYLSKKKLNKIGKLTKTERKKIDLEKKIKVFLFISQPIYERYKNKLGYTEYSVLKDFLNTVYLYKKNSTYKNIKIFIKLHPSDLKKKYDKLISDYFFLDIKFLLDDIDIFKFSKHCFSIIGIFSMILLNLSILNPNIISYQPTNKKNIFSFFNKLIIVSDKKNLLKFMINRNKNNLDFNQSNAINNIKNIINTFDKNL